MGGGAFLAKYDNEVPVGTQDISDNTWSIIKPLAASLDINMGKVLVATSKDSLIQGFIRNTGELPVEVKDIQITGANASEFTIVTGLPPFTIAVGDFKTIEFRFTPLTTGIRSANLSIITPIDNLYQTITGEGVQPLISIAVPSIDMGIVEIGKQKDSILTAIVKNIGSAPLTITSTKLVGSGNKEYEIISSPGSFVLQASEEKNLQLRFTPHTIGESTAQLQFEYNAMANDPARAQITGFGIGGSISIENDSAYAGDKRSIKIKLNKANDHLLSEQAPLGFTATITYNNSILYTDKSNTSVNVISDNENDTLIISSQWNGNNTEIGSIPVIATLGDRSQTNLELLSFAWLNEKSEEIQYRSDMQSGIFTLLGICPEGGERLFNADGKANMLMISPNPVSSTTEIQFSTGEKGMTRITMTDILGRQTEIANQEYSIGEHSIPIEIEHLTQGLYILTMQTPTQIFTQQVIVEK